MKPHVLLVALLAAFGSACTSMDKPRSALRVEPIMAVRHGGPDGQAYYQLGRYYAGQRRVDLAEQAYLKAIATDERLFEAYDALGRLYAERGQLERALRAFEKAAASAPEVAYIHNNLGFVYYLQGEFEQAHAAVTKALALDPGLARGWANLERIAAASAAAPLGETSKAQVPEMLHNEPLPPPKHDGFLASPEAPEIARVPVPAASPALAPAEEPRIAGGKFILVSAEREIVANGATIELSTENPGGPQRIGAGQSALAMARIEVSNGNGVTGFARKVGAQLRSRDVAVTRITNHASFAVEKTEIQFAPRYEEAARTLAARINLHGRFVASAQARPGSDIRIVLGRDASQPGWLATAFASLARS